MALRVRLLAPGNEKELHTEPSQFLPEEEILITTAEPQHHGVFKAATSATPETIILAEPNALGAVILTDLIVTTAKKAAGVVTLHFTDDTQTIDLAVFPVDIAVNIAIGFVGLFRGWRDARFEMVTSGATFDATVTVGYMKVPEGLTFAEWDALR